MKSILLAACGLLSGTACMHTSKVAVAPPPDNSYFDLAPGGRVRIVVPLLKAGATSVTTEPVRITGNTIVLSASNLLGYEVSSYRIEPRRGGQVKLRFIEAQSTKGGTTITEVNPPHLPFDLPEKPTHIRLIYSIRNSHADHNMAIAASKNLTTLMSFTKLLQEDPSACGTNRQVTCFWVPAGVAVRPE